MRLRNPAALLALLLVGGCGVANASGVCWAERRVLSERELIDRVIDSRMSWSAEPIIVGQVCGPDGCRPGDDLYVGYQDRVEFLARNPKCCEFIPSSDLFARALGWPRGEVRLVYRQQVNGSTPYDEAYYAVSTCGGVREFYGEGLTEAEYRERSLAPPPDSNQLGRKG